MSRSYKSFSEFYPFYLGEHRHPLNRRMHFIGTSIGIMAIIIAVVSTNPWWLLPGLLAAYGCAWFGHFHFEKNMPATFKYPVYSFLGDLAMYKDMLTGKLER